MKKTKKSNKSSSKSSKKRRHSVSSEEDWVEAENPSLQPKREEWLTKDDVDPFSYVLPKEKSPQKEKTISIAQQRELNPSLRADFDPSSTIKTPQSSFGDRGSSWRLIKLKNVYETAKIENRPVEEVALERYSTIEEFHQVVDESMELKTEGSGNKNRKRRNVEGFLNPAGSSKEDATFSKHANVDYSQKKGITLKKVCLSQDQLNKLKSQLLKAKLKRDPKYTELEIEYNTELLKFEQNTSVVIVDSSTKSNTKASSSTKPPKFEEFDKQGQRIRYAHDNDGQSLDDMVREEKIASKRSNIDRNLAKGIANDSRFVNSLDYLDEKAPNLSNVAKEKGENFMKNCHLCLDKSKLSIVAVGDKVHLALPQEVSMVPGHCLIIPNSHICTVIDTEDDVFDEIRNFMKCLIRMFAEENKGVIFIEQVLNLKKDRHTFIEVFPVPAEIFEQAPQFFKEAFLNFDEEWSTHQKITDTTKNGIRRSLVSNLPYIHVWFSPNEGFAHLIENTEDWPPWFGKEILAGMMDLDPSLWRKAKLMDPAHADLRFREFSKRFKKHDWTKML